ncbi:MAG: hypothetical protein [Bacteriophage sp.]|nr:MAG: hypothetical protein [Bacteriophage sp.]
MEAIMASKKTLSKQYQQQIKRINKRLEELAKEGYNIVGDFTPTTPKKPTRKQVEALKKVTPEALRRMADKNYNINIGKGKQITQKVAKSKKVDYRKKPVSARPPKPPKKQIHIGTGDVYYVADEGALIYEAIKKILEQPYSAGLNISPEIYYDNQQALQGLLDSMIAKDGLNAVLQRFADAGTAIIDAVQGFAYASDGNADYMQSWYSFVDILTGGSVSYELSDIADEMSDFDSDVPDGLLHTVGDSELAYDSDARVYVDINTGETIFEYDDDLMSWVDARTSELVSTTDIANYGG